VADRGSVLMLMPAGVLIVLVLGAMAVDLSVVHLGEREVSAAASAAVNDAVSQGLDEATLYDSGRYALDPTRVRQVIVTTLAAQDGTGRDLRLSSGPTLADADGDGAVDTVTLSVEMEVDYIFARGLPGGPDHLTVEATATASARPR
jgi:hypothetical protein